MSDGAGSSSGKPRTVVAAAAGGSKLAKPADNAGLLNSVVQVLWHVDAFLSRFEVDIDATTVSSAALPMAAALATIFRQLEDARENQIVRADILRVALTILHANDARLQMKGMDDAIGCYSAVIQHLHQELSAQAGKGTTASIVPDTLQMNFGAGSADVAGSATKFVVTVPASSLLNASLRNAAAFTPDQLDLVTGLNLSETLEKYNLPNHHDRIVDFGRLLDGVFRSTNQGVSPKLLNMPLTFNVGITWSDFSPSHEEVKTILASISPVISEADFCDLSSQAGATGGRGDDKASGSKKKKGLFRRLLGKPAAASGDGDDDEETEEIQPSRLMTLRALIAYHGSQYVSFYYSTEKKLWLFYDDARVSKVGPFFSEMITKVGRGRYQPVMLFYQAASNEDAKNTLRQFVSRRFSRRDESLFGHLDTVELPVPAKTAGANQEIVTAKVEDALGTVRLSEEEKAKFIKAPTTAATKSVQLTKGEALLSMQVQHRVTEKRMRYRHSFVQMRETKMGVFGKPKDRFAILARNMLAFYDATSDETDIKQPIFLIEVNAACSVSDASVDSAYTNVIGAIRLKSPSHHVELGFLSMSEALSWSFHLGVLTTQVTLEPTAADDKLLSLFSPPKGLGPDTDIVLRKLNLKMCVCGRQAKAMCARCYMQPYCALNCQRLHWRVHREACFGRSNEGQSAMEAAAKKPKEAAAEKE